MTTQARELASLVDNSGNLNLKGTISRRSDSLAQNFGADNDVSLTHVHNTGLLLNSTRQLQFGDSGTYINQSADGVLNLTSDTEVEINATTVDINANVDVSGNIVLAGTITVGDADDDNMIINANVNSHIIPNTDDTFDLGSSGQQWRNIYVDGTLEADAITVADTALAEYIADTAGAMFTSNTETGITATYQDGDNTIDLVLGTLNQDTTGTADNFTASANNSTDETVYPVFVDGATGSQGAETDTGLTYNPSSGILTATQFTGAVVGAVTGNVTGNASGTAATVTTAAQPAITSLGTLTTLTVDNVIINGTTIGHTGDTDLMTLASGVLTVAGELDATTLDISGDADIDGTLEADAITIAGVTLSETIADTVGAMVSSNTETNIAVTYEDGDNTLDFVIGTLNQDTTGLAGTATALASARTIHGVSFDGTANIDLSEEIADTVGAMVGSNTESGISVAYQDGDNTLDFTVATLNQDTTGLAGTATALATARTIGGTSFDGTANIAVGLAATATALASARTIGGTSFDGTANIVPGTATLATTTTVTDSTANTNFPIVFHNESNGLLDDTGALRYNPSTGTLLAPNLVVAGTTTQVNTVTMNAQNAVVFEGATADEYETTLSIVDPTADHTQYLINQGGYIPVLAAVSTTAISATPAELNYVDGVTSAIQTQLDAKLPLAGGTLSSTLTIPDYIIHDGNTATKFGFSAANTMNFISNGNDKLTLANSYAVFNDAGTDTDFRVESNNQTHMLFVDAGNDRIGIGTASPNTELVVQGKIQVREATQSMNAGIGTEASSALINFGINDSSNNRLGGSYTSSSQGGMYRVDSRSGQNLFQFLGRAASVTSDVTELMSITSDGKVGIGDTTPSYTLDIVPGQASAFRVKGGTNGTDVNCQIYNTGTSSGDGALLDISTVAGAGDPEIRWSVAGNENYTMGLDNSDADKLKISGGTSMGSSDYMTFYGNKVGIGSSLGTATPDGTLHVMQGSAGSITASTDKNSLVVENSTHGGISVLTPDAAEAGFFTGHPGGNRTGEWHTRRDTNKMRFGSRNSGMDVVFYSGNWVNNMTLFNTGQLGVSAINFGAAGTPRVDSSSINQANSGADLKYNADGGHTFKTYDGGWVDKMAIEDVGVTHKLSNAGAGQSHVLYNGGYVTMADDATITLSGVANTGCLISIGSYRKSGQNVAYAHGLIFLGYNIGTTAGTIIADETGFLRNSDTDGYICVYKTAGTGSVTVKNRLGISNNVSMTIHRYQGN